MMVIVYVISKGVSPGGLIQHLNFRLISWFHIRKTDFSFICCSCMDYFCKHTKIFIWDFFLCRSLLTNIIKQEVQPKKRKAESRNGWTSTEWQLLYVIPQLEGWRRWATHPQGDPDGVCVGCSQWQIVALDVLLPSRLLYWLSEI